MSEVATKCSKKKITFKIEKPLIGQWQCKIHDVLGNTYDCGKRDFYSSKEIDCKSYEGSDFKIFEKIGDTLISNRFKFMLHVI